MAQKLVFYEEIQRSVVRWVNGVPMSLDLWAQWESGTARSFVSDLLASFEGQDTNFLGGPNQVVERLHGHLQKFVGKLRGCGLTAAGQGWAVRLEELEDVKPGFMAPGTKGSVVVVRDERPEEI